MYYKELSTIIGCDSNSFNKWMIVGERCGYKNIRKFCNNLTEEEFCVLKENIWKN